MPLVASNSGSEASAACPGFRDGVDHLFVTALVASGVRRAGIDPARAGISGGSGMADIRFLSRSMKAEDHHVDESRSPHLDQSDPACIRHHRVEHASIPPVRSARCPIGG